MVLAISMENKLDDVDRRLKLVEDALEELVQTRVHHVDLTDIENTKDDDTEEEFRAPVTVKKKRKAAAATT